ncbi:hypothetical protein ILUMI_03993, partial [Ignelater luminosus]
RRNKQSPPTGQQLWVSELVGVRALSCPGAKKLSPMANELISGQRQKNVEGKEKPLHSRSLLLLDHRAFRVVNQRNPCELAKDENSLRIGTWNMRSMFESGTIHNTIQVIVDDHLIYYSGDEGTQHWNGVGIIIHKRPQNEIEEEVKQTLKDELTRIIPSEHIENTWTSIKNATSDVCNKFLKPEKQQQAGRKG